jgi:hypothetical protein
MTGDQHQPPGDPLGHAVVDPDGETLHLVDPLAPELVDAILTSAHRLIVTVEFVPDSAPDPDRDRPW